MAFRLALGNDAEALTELQADQEPQEAAEECKDCGVCGLQDGAVDPAGSDEPDGIWGVMILCCWSWKLSVLTSIQ